MCEGWSTGERTWSLRLLLTALAEPGRLTELAYDDEDVGVLRPPEMASMRLCVAWAATLLRLLCRTGAPGKGGCC